MKDERFKICFISGKLGDVDGVSLEADKWMEVLSELGHDLFAVAGLFRSELDYVAAKKRLLIEDLSFDSPRQSYYESSVFPFLSKRPIHLSDKKVGSIESELLREGREIAAQIYEFIQQNKIDLIIAENTNAMPMTLLGAVAVYELASEMGMAVLFHHHDFWWERSRFSDPCIDSLMNRIMPPRDLSLEHVVISSYAAHILRSVKRVMPHIIPNCEDFEHPPVPDEYNSQFRRELGFREDDILIVQPTRIVPRKRIEDSLRLTGRLMERYPELADRIRFIISLYHGDELETDYLQEIQVVASRYEISLHMISDRVASNRCRRKGKICFTNRDVLVNADLVTYLPLWEGFGNALLEAFAARVPVVSTTYLVYKTDIKGSGVRPLEIRDHYDEKGRLIIDDRTLEAVYRLIADKEYAGMRVEESFCAAAAEFGYSQLRERLGALIVSYADEIRASRRRVRKSQQSYYV